VAKPSSTRRSSIRADVGNIIDQPQVEFELDGISGRLVMFSNLVQLAAALWSCTLTRAAKKCSGKHFSPAIERRDRIPQTHLLPTLADESASRLFILALLFLNVPGLLVTGAAEQ
jgi:hypothetical protein